MQIPKQAIFLSCLRVYSDFSYFLPGLFRMFCWVLGAVLGISAVSATFSQIFSGFWAGSRIYFFPIKYRTGKNIQPIYHLLFSFFITFS